MCMKRFSSSGNWYQKFKKLTSSWHKRLLTYFERIFIDTQRCPMANEATEVWQYYVVIAFALYFKALSDKNFFFVNLRNNSHGRQEAFSFLRFMLTLKKKMCLFFNSFLKGVGLKGWPPQVLSKVIERSLKQTLKEDQYKTEEKNDLWSTFLVTVVSDLCHKSIRAVSSIIRCLTGFIIFPCHSGQILCPGEEVISSP